MIYSKGYVPIPLSNPTQLGIILGDVTTFLTEKRTTSDYVTRRVRVTTQKAGGTAGGGNQRLAALARRQESLAGGDYARQAQAQETARERFLQFHAARPAG